MSIGAAGAAPKYSWLAVVIYATMTIACSAVLVGLILGRPPKSSEHQCPQPWMVYETSTATLRDVEAIEHWLLERAKSHGATYHTRDGKSGAQITLHLSSYESDPPRSKLLEIAAEALANLPAGSPVTIEVETLENAIADKKGYIRRCEQDIAELRKKHGE